MKFVDCAFVQRNFYFIFVKAHVQDLSTIQKSQVKEGLAVCYRG